MTNRQPHNDDGQPIRAKPGRPAKPGLTDVELQAIQGLGEQQAAAKVSDMRGANLGSISAAEASRRRVSHDWVRRQRLRKTQPTQNSNGARVEGVTQNSSAPYGSGPRTIRDDSPEAQP